MYLSPGRIDMPFPEGMRVDYASLYTQREAAAQQAVRRNGGALWYVGNDPTGFVFEDSIGTLPATGTDPIGLLLDRSYGASNLGPELRGNGVLTVVGTSSGGSYNTSTGSGLLTRTDVSNRTDVIVSGTTIGKTYKVTVTNTGPADLSVRAANGGITLWTVPAGQTVTGYAVPQTNATITLVCNFNSSSSAFNELSIKEVLGFPALQATAGNRPTLELQANGYYGMRFDGTADWLTSALASTSARTFIAAVTPLTVGPGNQTIFDGLDNLNRAAFSYAADGSVTSFAGASLFAPAGTLLSGTSYILATNQDGASSKLWVNGNLLASGNSGTSNPATGIRLGADRFPAAYTNGLISLLAYSPSGVFSDPDRIAIERFAALLSGATYP